jgi:hypothetical protein
MVIYLNPGENANNNNYGIEEIATNLTGNQKESLMVALLKFSGKKP